MSRSGHGGNLTYLSGVSGIARDKILDFSSNINPLGLPEWFRPLVASALETVVHYPDPDCTDLIAAGATRYGAAPEQVAAGNGSTEILHLLPRAVSARRAVIPVPSYADYWDAAVAADLDVDAVPLREEDDFALDWEVLESSLGAGDMVFLCQPNNPTGRLEDAFTLRNIATRHPTTFFVVDEAFGDFVQDMDSCTRDRPANVIVLLSLTKIFAIPGLRLGLAIADAPIVQAIRGLQPLWSVNTLAQVVGAAALQDTEFVERSREFVTEHRSRLVSDLRSIPGLTVYPGRANFLLMRIDDTKVDAPSLAQRMLAKGIAIRVCDNFKGLDGRFFRVAVRTAEENARLCDVLRDSLEVRAPAVKKSRTPALMFQGTSSNAGKSVLTAAMGRILLQDGYRVAPFKAQNMSLNSFVTCKGGEMGRAQVVQAQACRLEPDVRMNPILLKPNTDTGSQVIVLGKPVGNKDVMEYVGYKPLAFEAVKSAYDSLAQEYDVMVIEGAGSPGEVNLKHHDIVNMQMARYAGAPVLLVGDIDRGGVFASFVGTMEVLAEWERALVAGFVVNRFRGNKELLDKALEYTRRHTGRPVLGIVPYLHNHGLPEEDSVSFKGGMFDEYLPNAEAVEIAIIDLPHISNFTDFDALRIEPDARVTVVRTARDLNRPDAVILPGSKNTIGDLRYLRENGFESVLRRLAAQGTELIGICGGFQMLGDSITDPHGLESESGSINGLGFLNVTTVLAPDKTLTRSDGIHLESGLPVRGYEIHHGLSAGPDLEPLVRHNSGRCDGARSPDGSVWGTYFHGIFDSDVFRRWFIDRLRIRKGLEPIGKVCASYDLEPPLDRLAEVVRESLDMAAIYRLMGL
ncbi:MAG: cobyric acid synthase [Desulfomonile sp.]|nr:cobyric acid synthase [Desulfomonile sp.]